MTYQEELERHLELLEQHIQIPEYFKKCYIDFKLDDTSDGKKKVGVIGDNFYSLYIKAFGMQPILISGGSYFTGEHTDMFPQISDPVAKSAIGLLLDPEYQLWNELSAVVIVALNDSYKKAIAYLKEMGVHVIQVEPIPYIREGNPFSMYKQQYTAINDISKIKMGVFREGVFKKELNSYGKAYDLMEENAFLALPTMIQSFFIHLLHSVEDKEEFFHQLEEFLDGQSDIVPQKQVTFMGSVITSPNRKLFQICQEIGITHVENLCERLPYFGDIDLMGGTFSLLGKSIQFQHKNAFLPATIGEMQHISLPKDTDGIIYYLLKGQVSEAYEAERMEELAIEQGIPFLCVETDYTDTDSEQLKIRVEAFYEMLSATPKKELAVST